MVETAQRKSQYEWKALADTIIGEILKRPNPDAWEVRVWDWSNDTLGFDPAGAYKKAEKQGHDLATAISNVQNPYKYVHLIAHSAGSRLIDTVAEDLFVKSGVTGNKPFIHLTFLDAYTPENNEFSYGQNANFAEHYVDKTGGGLNPTNADLLFAFNFDITDWTQDKDDRLGEFGHQWPIRWYTRSIASPVSTGDIVGMSPGFPLSFESGNNKFCELPKRFPPNGKCQLKLDPQVFFACNSSSIDFSGVAFHRGHS